LATACDIVLAASSARFGYPEVKIGFVPAMVMAILRRNVSEKRAFELITRGAEISADQAKLFGLVNHVFPESNFAEDVNQYVGEFEKMSRSAIGLTKTLLYQMDGMAFPEALETGADVNVIARLTDDCQQNIAKFLQKDRS
jgi:methylglutaconyl-CoA hydratase